MFRVGRYEVVRELGRGGMGVVLLANDTLLRRQVAIKKVLAPGAGSPLDAGDVMHRFIREAQAAASLNHPHLVAIHDVLNEADATYIVMEFVEGQSLAQLAPVGTCIPPETAIRILRQCASALDYAHSRGIVHRDIKPANILLDESGSVKIADFGLAKLVDSDTVTRGGIVGTLEYMSPEQLDGQRVDKTTDQYSLAVVAYRILTGCRTFGAANMVSFIAMVLHKMPEPASTKNHSLPPAVDAVLNRGMAKNPAARFASCAEFVSELVRALDALGGASKADARIPAFLKRPIFIELAGGALVLLVAGWFVMAGLRHAPSLTPVKVTGQDGISVAVGRNQCVTPNCTLSLQPGNYLLGASRDGYAPVKQPLVVQPGQSAMAVSVSLAPLPQTLQVNTNFPSGTVAIDRRRVADLVNGSFSMADIPPGEHEIQVSGGGADFKARWRSVAGAAPAIIAEMEAKDVEATLVSSVGIKGRVISNRDSQLVRIDGSAAGYTIRGGDSKTPPEISLIGEGVRKLEIGSRSTFLEVRRNPALSILLMLDRDAGTLFVESKPGDAKVYLNGRPYGRTTANGVIRVPVDSGKYQVRVAKDGFRASAGEAVELAKGEEKKLTFTLVPLSGSVSIAGLTSGSEITVDGKPRGMAGSSQSFRIDDLAPGDHTIQVAREGYVPVRVPVQVTDGQTTPLTLPKLLPVKKDTSPAPPDPSLAEVRDWERVRASNTINDLQSYLTQHPGGAHADEARTRLNQLRQSQAREAEESAWSGLDTHQKAALQQFLAVYGSGPHASEARSLLSGIEKKEADDLAVQHAAAQRMRDQASVKQTLATYEAAFNLMNISELQAVWALTPSEVKKIRDQFKNAKTFQVKLTLAAPIIINGDSAAAECIRTVTVIPLRSSAPKPKAISNEDRVRLTLIRTGASTWQIRAITRI